MFRLLIIFFLMFGVISVFGQKKTGKVRVDSSFLKKTSALLHRMDSLRVSDSLKRAGLQLEIQNLKGSTNAKTREVLEKKLRAVEQEDSVKKHMQLLRLSDLKESTTGFPVAPFRDTLFIVYTPMGSFTAEDRAIAISAKIENLYDNVEFNPDSLKVILTEAAPEIGYQDMMVMSINELEALWFGRKSVDIASDYRNIIQVAIKRERVENSLTNILLRIAAIVLIITGIYFLILLINSVFRKISIWLRGQKDKKFKGIRLKDYQFLDSRRELQAILFISNLFRLLIIVVALYIALPLLFSVFPWTRGIAETLINWITSPIKHALAGLINYLPNLFTVGVISIVTHYIIKFVKFVATEIESGALVIEGFYPDWARPTLSIVTFLIYAFSFIIIFPYLPGSDSPIFQGVSVFVGVLFSFGSSSAISNAVAGLVITYMRPFKVGDRIKIGDISGDVIEKSLLVTRIRTIKNENITVPNSTVLGGSTTNYTTSAKEIGLILHSGVTIGYDVPWKQVHELLINAALATKGVLNEENRKPFVLQTSLDDFYVSYQINIYTEDSQRMAGIYSELHQNIQDKFNEGNVEILSPHYRAARDGNMVAIPSSYLPKDYTAPSFVVRVQNPDGK